MCDAFLSAPLFRYADPLAVSFLSLSTDTVTQAYPDEMLAVTGDATVGEVVQLMRAQKGSCVLISGGQQVDGIFTERDALKWMADGAPAGENIRSRMTASPTTLAASSSVAQAIEMMSEGGYRHLPVVDPTGKPVGVCAVRGLVHYLVDHFPQTIYNLPPEPGRRGSDREGA